jgi:hypothetical protein
VLRLAVPLAALALVAPGQRVGQAGVTVELPRGWHAIPSAAAPASQNDPATRIAAASGPISFGHGCGQLDYRFPSTGVAVVVLEWVRLKPALPPRPARFTQKTLPVRSPPALECFAGAGGSVEFADHGRRLDAFVLLGRHASAALADRARAVLDTLRVARRG